jgi:ATP-dependent RNA helicase RhlE
VNFTDFHLHPAILAGIQTAGYDVPTPIQEKAIPPILEGKDLIGLAQTGTGKTAAFALPILQRLMNNQRGQIGAAVISPTRELAEQTSKTFNTLGQIADLRSTAIYGGVSMDQQLRELRQGVEVVVGCPGRLLDHLWKGSVDFTHLEVLVIDEADRMFDMGFLPSIRMILECILQQHQTLLFSATMPEDINRLVKEILHNPVTVKIGQTLPANTVSHALYPVEEYQKTALLEEILRQTKTDSVLIFTRTKIKAERVAQQLKKSRFPVTSLQGNMSQPERQTAIDGFRSGRYKIMVATDIAARGLDILSISHVINYDMPEDTDAYIHRIGRTGRIEQTGKAFTFVTEKDRTAIRDLEKLLNTKLERSTLPDFDYAKPPPPRRTGRYPRKSNQVPNRQTGTGNKKERVDNPHARHHLTNSQSLKTKQRKNIELPVAKARTD